MATNTPVSLRKPWVDRWTTNARRMRSALGDAGLSRRDAEQWLGSPFHGYLPDTFVEFAKAWHRVGLDTRAAIAWAATEYFDPAEALDWHIVGYTPRQAMFVSEMTQFTMSRTLEESYGFCEEWRRSGLPAGWVCLALAVGEAGVPEARGRYVEAQSDPLLEDALHEKALDCGVDARALKITDFHALLRSMR